MSQKEVSGVTWELQGRGWWHSDLLGEVERENAGWWFYPQDPEHQVDGPYHTARGAMGAAARAVKGVRA